jgi:hypothetical protein
MQRACTCCGGFLSRCTSEPLMPSPPLRCWSRTDMPRMPTAPLATVTWPKAAQVPAGLPASPASQPHLQQAAACMLHTCARLSPHPACLRCASPAQLWCMTSPCLAPCLSRPFVALTRLQTANSPLPPDLSHMTPQAPAAAAGRVVPSGDARLPAQQAARIKPEICLRAAITPHTPPHTHEFLFISSFLLFFLATLLLPRIP